jgi:hypothetical protein
VENQAIDRTHRIGQVNKVIAYRLLVKNSIEEKIRNLQRQKSSLAADILGEENFTRALSLDDFRFLIGADRNAVLRRATHRIRKITGKVKVPSVPALASSYSVSTPAPSNPGIGFLCFG